jgi:hypothetical protein
MKKLLLLMVVFIMCEKFSQAQPKTRTQIKSTIDTKVINNPATPLRAADLNSILTDLLYYPVDSVFIRNDSMFAQRYDQLRFIKKANTAGYGQLLSAGVLSVDSFPISTRAWRQKGIDSVVSLINTKTGATTYDSTMVIADSDTPWDSVFKAKTWLEWKPLSRSPAIDLNNQNFRFVQSTHRFGTGLLSDEVMQWGWNIGGTLDWQAWSKPSIYYQMEQNYVPGAGSSQTELHTIWRQPSNNDKWRLQSWTLDNNTGNIDLYFTDGRFYHKRTDNTIYFLVNGGTLPSMAMTAPTGEGYLLSMSAAGFAHDYTGGTLVGQSVAFRGVTQEKHSASDVQFGEKTASTGATITIKNATTALSSYASTASSTTISTLTNVAINLKPNNTTALSAASTGITISSLATGSTAPTTTGTTKMVITDANGFLSFASIPSADSFTYTTWGRSQSRFDSLGVKVVHNTGTETIAGAKTFSTDATFSGNILGASSTLIKIGTSSSDVALVKMSSQTLGVRIGDNSDYAYIRAKSVESVAGGYIGWQGRSLLLSPSDGNIWLTNNNANDFGRLQFGGTTSSFPALKRSTTGLQIRLADDSGYSFLDAIFKPVSMADSAAPNNSIYYSTDSSKLVYKDALGVVNNLY